MVGELGQNKLERAEGKTDRAFHVVGLIRREPPEVRGGGSRVEIGSHLRQRKEVCLGAGGVVENVAEGQEGQFVRGEVGRGYGRTGGGHSLLVAGPRLARG